MNRAESAFEGEYKFLDKITNTLSGFCFSFFLLYKNFTGNCCIVQRASDMTTITIGYVDGFIDYDSIITFCQGTEGRIITRFNQMPNWPSGHSGSISVTWAKAPVIYRSGTLQTDPSLSIAAPLFENSRQCELFDNYNLTNITDAKAIFVSTARLLSYRNSSIMGLIYGAGGFDLSLLQTTSSNTISFYLRDTSQTPNLDAVSIGYNLNTTYLVSAYHSNETRNLRLNGVKVAESSTQLNLSPRHDNFRQGRTRTLDNYYQHGYLDTSIAVLGGSEKMQVSIEKVVNKKYQIF